jgi:nicotinate phosphoribosyltransferase
LGTRLVTGRPVNGVYKLVEIGDIPVMKESSSKVTYPGRKQIFRQYAGDRAMQDYLSLAAESPPAGAEPLLQPVMQQGQLITPLDDLSAIAQRTARSVAALSPPVRQVQDPTPYTVEITPALAQLTQTTRQQTPSPSPVASGGES